jgi:hypothetical protein
MYHVKISILSSGNKFAASGCARQNLESINSKNIEPDKVYFSQI